jgi:hypothetical protein
MMAALPKAAVFIFTPLMWMDCACHPMIRNTKHFSVSVLDTGAVDSADIGVEYLLEERQRAMQLSFSRLVLGIGKQVSPQLANFYRTIDAKMHPIAHPAWQTGECEAIVRNLTNTADSAQEPLKIHTGILLNEAGSARQWVEPVRKIRLLVLSVLASQRPSATVYFWTDVDPQQSKLLQQALAPVLQNASLAPRLVLRAFHAEDEFKQISPETSHVLLDLYTRNKVVASKADIMRAAILHNYGGAWFDTDVLLIQDLSPLQGQDVAYLGQADWINNAFLAVSRPRSAFIVYYMAAIAARGMDADGHVGYTQFGPELLTNLFKGMSEQNGTFHVLPTCFFDGGWSGEAPVSWDGFFGDTVTSEKQISYLHPMNNAHTTFAYHWHNRWDKPIRKGSPADTMESIYAEKLGLTL